MQILGWYDELVGLTDEAGASGPRRGARARGRSRPRTRRRGRARETDRLREVLGERHRWHAVRGYLHELGGDLPAAATAYADAARLATDVPERDHLVRQAARTRAAGVASNA